jgi:hypothetical protein
MKALRTIYFIICIAYSIIILSCNKKIVTVFDSSIKEHADYIITKQKLNFHFNDSIYPFTVFVPQNGEIFLRKNSQDSLHPGLILLSFKDSKRYNEKYIFNKDSLIDLYSYFPLLIKHDSSIINHYDNPESFNYKLVYEPNYSYLLHLTNEPILLSEKNVQEIRVTSPSEYVDFFGKPKTRFTVRLKILNNNSQLFLTEGVFDSLGNFNITRKDSCIIKDKDILKITKAIHKIDFKKEYYFAELGLDIGDKFLFEYKNIDDYYILERAIYNRYNHGSEVLDVYAILLTMKNEYLEKK